MPTSVVLRPVASNDREFLFRVYASTRTDELALVPWTNAQKETFLRQQFEAQDRHYQSAYGDAQYSVVQVDGSDAGRLYAWRGAQEIRIVDIALLPAWRNQGIGTDLLRTLCQEAERTRKSLTIHVEVHNPAQRLYQRLGFQRIKENGIYWLLEWKPSAGEGTASPSENI
ncbi:MAG TPA: GNAT family N-acetyltransferase [Candidatus Limnocylindria bacterium]|jgi:ribosomal protein S18 acetylase RimI-like enzyme|nr:GNAT family N-acetyltransferase [Candidatus Limnocylindria bacterium]